MDVHSGQFVALDGVICGGGPREDARIGFLGVFLDHDPADFGLPRHHVSTGYVRTGLSEAIATDLEDDSYDLSWLNTLPTDDDEGVDQLQALLMSEDEPIDRHYMFCELEHVPTGTRCRRRRGRRCGRRLAAPSPSRRRQPEACCARSVSPGGTAR
jgi:hypothetical protein